ncbi:MAG: hypothetical protein GY822_17760 [Deltaproteobacteria bacterium]|nr:hypothetical protein [Deltaproteobacteria bacterium]
MQGRMYDAMVLLLRFIARFFFRRVEVVGAELIPEAGPVVFVGNHPNSLLDPMLVLTSCKKRRISFAAKDVLFKNPAFRLILKAVGAVPIKRRSDHGAVAINNDDTFKALHAVLDEGGAFGIFPEGISHFRTELQPLKTGAARLALEAFERGLHVAIVPCGLNYRRRTRMRGQVLVQYGAPFFISDDDVQLRLRDALKNAEEKKEDPNRAQARALTEIIDDALRAETVNAKDFETLRTLDTVRRLYAPPERRLSLKERSELHRRFLEHYERLEHLPEVKALYNDVTLYNFKLDALGLKDEDLRRPLSRLFGLFRISRHLFRMSVMIPFAVPGLIFHFPVFAAAVVAGETLVSRKDVIATTKLMVGSLTVFLGYGTVMAWLLFTLPFPTSIVWALLAAAALFLSAAAALSVLEQQHLLRQGMRVLVVLMHLKQEVEWLKEKRKILRGQILAAVETYVDPGLERIVRPDPAVLLAGDEVLSSRPQQ